MVPILLIDDDQELSLLLQEYLREEEFQVRAAYDGVCGLEDALHHAYAAIILDLMLPRMSGLEVLKLLRRESTVPVLVLSACGSEKDRVAAIESGADDYLTKPFRPQELVARLRTLLEYWTSPTR